MAAPTATARVAPVGKKLENGHRCLITFAADPDVSLWEIGVTPPGVEGGDPVDTNTQWNDTYNTRAPRTLKDTTAGGGTCAFEAAVITQIYALVNVATTITYLFADGTTEAHYGWLRNFTRDEMVEGTMPTASFSIEHSNFDHVNDVESGPTVTSVAGT